MSRRGGPAPAVFSKGLYDILGDDNDYEEEDEVEEPAAAPAATEEPQSNGTTAPLSKSARKRLARQAAKSTENVNAVLESAKQSVAKNTDVDLDALAQSAQETASSAADTVSTAAADAADAVTATAASVTQQVASVVPTANGHASSESAKPQANGHEKKTPTPGEKASAAASSASATVNEAAESAKEGAKTFAGAAKSAISQPESSSKPNSTKTKPSQSSFAPSLPESLPGKSADLLPANRKRKTPQDFTPSGPGNTQSPSSPSKMGVKFEDGVAPGEGHEGEKTMSPPPKPVVKKDRNAVERTIWTFIMIGGFIALLCMGHPYMILLVMLCQALVYKEVTALFDLRDHGANKIDVAAGEKGDKWSKTLNWYFFVVTNYFLYGESIIYYFKHIVFVDAYFIPFARNHRFISFMLYVVGFVGFVANLQRQYLRQQFALFCWVHISLLLIVVSSHFIINNILEGLVWFFVPASLVICNDVMAYVCGKLFGRTPLIKLSPKKTVEGFVGAFVCTLLFGLAWGTFFMRFPYMICPARDLGTSVFSQVDCRPNPVFVWRDFEFSGAARSLLSTILGHAPPAIPYAPFQIHVLVMATFASLVAPFGGFFASGFKRAFNIKDFGHSIPGHGGMTDRMDCQFMMGLFSYVYYSSLIRIQYVTVGSIMQTVVTSLSAQEQVELLADLKKFLVGQGIKA
ncbi:hypothetical protein IAU60_001514 [Kwoniella sp. DSM 27419]